MYMIGFNGPPGSGKDTAAKILADKMDAEGVTLPVRIEALSMPLRHIAYAMVGYTGRVTGEFYERFKTTYFKAFGVTGRQLLIHVSEKYLKPVYGQDIMVRLLLERNEGFPGVIILSDTGFQLEVDYLRTAVPGKNLVVTQVHRPGHSFAGDSREWVHGPDMQTYRINNNSNLDALQTEVHRIYGRIVNQMDWRL